MGLIFLCGLPGSGKTTVGRLLAQVLEVEFIDLDEVIVNETGLSVPQLFDREGESYFRECEQRALRALPASKAAVVALGGGIFETESTLEFVLNAGTLIYLDADPSVIAGRNIQWENRPLLKDASDAIRKLEALLERRRERYEKAHIQIVIKAASDSRQVVEEIAVRLNR